MNPFPKPLSARPGLKLTGVLAGITLLLLVALPRLSAATSWPTLDQTLAKWNPVPLPEVERAAEAGNTNAQHYLGYCYSQGLRVPQTADKALSWFQRALNGGCLPSAHNLALIYQRGAIVPRDEAAAARYYRQAAEKGFTASMIGLGRLYRFGGGRPKDDAEAIRWFARASEAGDSLGTLNLGWMYG